MLLFFFLRHHWGNRLVIHHYVPIHILNHPALFYCSHCSPDKLDPETLFKFSYKRVHIHSSHSLSFSFCLAPVNRRGKHAWFPYAHSTRLLAEHSSSWMLRLWPRQQNLSTGHHSKGYAAGLLKANVNRARKASRPLFLSASLAREFK